MIRSRYFVNATKFIKSNSPELLAGLAIGGVGATAYFSAKAGYYTAKRLAGEAPDQPLKEKVEMVWKFYIPASLIGVVTVGSIIGSNKASGRKTAAAVTAYSVTERAFSDYKEKVIEQIGKGKEQKIRDEIAQDRVQKSEAKDVIIAGSGTVLCCELHTGRYFRSDMETLRKAENAINFRVVHDIHVMLDEFYDLIGLPHTSTSGNIGWDSDKLLSLQFSTVLSPSGEPCIAFDYNYTKTI